MKAQQIMHPDDAKALQVLRQADKLNRLIKRLMEHGEESQYYGENLGNLLCITQDNFPDIYHLLRQTARRVDIPVPELYVYNDPVMNAYTYGDTHPFIAISSSVLEKLHPIQIQGILAHECGHILCRHTLYLTLLNKIENLGDVSRFITETLSFPIYCAMQFWSRRCEFSADRCAAAVVGAENYQKALLSLTSGLTDVPGDPRQLILQGEKYEQMCHDSLWNRIQQNFRVSPYSHPQMCIRVLELDRWKDSYSYKVLRQQVQLAC